MPKLVADDMETSQIGGHHAFQFSGTRLTKLAGLSTSYVLVTIARDETGSTQGYETLLQDMTEMCVTACQKCPTASNLLLRLIRFSDRFPNGVEEIHGFKPIGEIDVSSYPKPYAGGLTPLYDALYSVVGATNSYGAQLNAGDYDAAGVTFLVTDGVNNSSVMTANAVKSESDKAIKGEILTSYVGVLIGINAQSCKTELADVAQSTGMEFRDAGKATPQNIAKLAHFVSQSVSSTSQAVASGNASKSAPISASI